MNRINEARGKAGGRLLELQEAARDVGRREREVQAERGEAERRVAELEEARREALMAEELAAAGEVPEGGHDLAKTERALAKARAELAADPWSARLEALARLRGRREADAERFAVEHLDELAAEVGAFLVEGNGRIRVACAELRALLAERELARQDLDSLARLMPPPSDASTYRVSVPEDGPARRLAGAAVQGQALEPPLPRELDADSEERDEIDGPVFEHATGERLR